MASAYRALALSAMLGARYEETDMTVRAYVGWSIYVRTSSIQKVRDTHLPATVEALGDFEFDWDILQEDENPGLYRLVNYQNLSGETAPDLILPVLQSAYQLRDGWTVWGLHQLTSPQVKHLAGHWQGRESSKPPAIESALFEMEPGYIEGKLAAGGWQTRS
jgi:hypothetical protein